MSAPRVRCIFQNSNWFSGEYRGHTVDVEREHLNADWYIQVLNVKMGVFCYDGYWRESAGKSMREAVLEALRGAMLFPRVEVERPPSNRLTAAAKVKAGLVLQNCLDSGWEGLTKDEERQIAEIARRLMVGERI